MRQIACTTAQSYFGLALSLLTCATIPAPLIAQVPPPEAKAATDRDPRTAWWREAKFGMFIHWGIYAVSADATDLKGNRSIAEWYFSNKQKQVKDYEKFAARFNPVKFDARKWVMTAKDAGMKYIVITSKHHDGFCMFDSKLTDYDIVDATPFKRDPMKELAAECKKQGIRLCFYHSIMDWHHPDYVPRRPWEADTRPATGADLNRYLDYMKGQLRELLTNYGPIGIIWFDGGWEHKADELHATDVVAMMRSLQPGLIINDRINLPEDYDTPEQRIPANALPAGRLWETCMTMNDTWGYARDDHHWKSTVDLVRKLCDIAHKGGNFLLNVGPTAEGEFPEEINQRLAQIGAWMKVNGDSIYGTTRSPFRRMPFNGRCTVKGDTLYLHVFTWPSDGLRIVGLQTPVRAARALAGGEALKVTASLADGGTVLIEKPRQIDPVATVVALSLAGAPAVSESELVLRPSADGGLILKAVDAEIHGDTAQYESGNGLDNIGYWTNPKDYVTWTCEIGKEGGYLIELEYASQPGTEGSEYTVSLIQRDTIGAFKSTTTLAIEDSVQGTGAWSRFRTKKLFPVPLKAGRLHVEVRATSMPHGAVMNLRQVKLTPVK